MADQEPSSPEFEWEVVPNPARRVMFWLAVTFGVFVIGLSATAVDGFQDYSERSGGCASVGFGDDECLAVAKARLVT